MDVEVERLALQRGEISESRFFRPFAQGRLERALARFQVPAHLQPSTEAAMMMEEEPAAVVDDEEARRDVAGLESRSGEGVRLLQKTHHLFMMLPFCFVGGAVADELLPESGDAFHQCDGNQ